MAVVEIFDCCLLGYIKYSLDGLPTAASILNIEMDATGSSKTLVTAYQTARYRNSRDHNQNNAVMLSAISSQVTPTVYVTPFLLTVM